MDEQSEIQPQPTSILHTLGEEIIRIITPVSICMLLVVLLVSILNNDDNGLGGFGSNISTLASIAYSEDSSDSTWDKFKGALLNSLVFVGVVTVVTFILVLLFYWRCTTFLKYYMGFSAFLVLGFVGGEVAVFVVKALSIPVDAVTFMVVLYNFTVVGVLAVFMGKVGIFVKQGYLVVIGMLVAYWFTLLPEWTTWVLLVAMALYDLAAVLLPGGPLRLLVELAISRDEDIPALVYEARPVSNPDLVPSSRVAERRVWRDRSRAESDSNGNLGASSSSNLNVGDVSGNGSDQSERIVRVDSELSAPLIQQPPVGSSEDFALEGIGLGSSGAIKLGLGDFIFYSVLVGRAAMYDFMTVYACYLAIIAGLGTSMSGIAG
ncbi:OLC1v1012108C1 [Oldenlandia corymbosa var. corymbosa]|uniref:Presenilin n=1 Tax=Oldenlandia corymbosa var. corymbosa TaxID=529605 RepID=A0AAV1DVC2_OLDCO|nr:OLC1v1012108C1 [Oldenlandia corymbosa var. corymbosa]